MPSTLLVLAVFAAYLVLRHRSRTVAWIGRAVGREAAHEPAAHETAASDPSNRGRVHRDASGARLASLQGGGDGGQGGAQSTGASPGLAGPSPGGEEPPPGTTPMLRAIGFVEQGIAALVILVLVLGVLLVLWNVAVQIAGGFRTGLDDYGLTQLLSQALLALMIAEIISSVSSLFERRVLDAIPLLVIGVIASIRRLLVISAEAANFVAEGEPVPDSMLIELGILTVSVGVFAWSIRQVELSKRGA